MTFSLVARSASTGQFGCVIASSSPAVAARCVYAQAGVGAVNSQNVTDPRLGPRALRLLAEGATAAEVAAIMARLPHSAFRQVLVVDVTGGAAVHSGPRALGVWGAATATDVAAGGNLLRDAGVPQAMVAAFAAAPGSLGDRLVTALQAGLSAGGEAGPVHSAGLKIVDRQDWPVADLRVDWTEACPVAALADLWALWQPQMAAYVTRALSPDSAPGFGVPGDP